MSLGMHDENKQVENIKFIVIGGGGSNAIDHMINEKVAGVTFLCANTDLQALQRSKAHMNVQLGEEITKGLGAGANPDIGRQAAEETLNEIGQMLEGSHMLFIAAGAFHVSKPSDLIPELQGRFPIRVELDNLTNKDFVKILSKPKNALLRQYEALIESEGVR